MSGLFFVTVLLTDGPEGAEENITHQQCDFHDASSSLNWSILLKHQTPSAIRRMRPIDFSEQRALRRDLLFAGGHTNKKRTKQNENKDTHPSKNCWRLKEKYRSRSSRDMNTFLPYNCCSLSCGDPFVTHHLYVKLDFILGQTNLLLQLATKFQW